MAKKEGNGTVGEYFERLAIYLIFAICAFISLIVWIFNWICWNKKYCCFDAFDDYCNKVFVWWLSWIFLCGVLACCIAGFVTANRFGFSLYGTQCAYERIYDDIMYGQKKATYPKWEGKETVIGQINKLLGEEQQFTNNLFSSSDLFNHFLRSDSELGQELDKLKDLFIFPFPKDIIQSLINIKSEDQESALIQINNYIYPFVYYYNNFFTKLIVLKNMASRLEYLKKNLIDFKDAINNLNDYKSQFINDFTYYINVAKAMGKIIPIIYFSLLLTFVVASGALLITYFCKKKNQQWWIFPMHIAWNGLRFFIFSFFMYGCAYGMLFLGAKDAIAYLKYGAFDEDNIKGEKEKVIIIPKNSQPFFQYCLFNNPAYESLKNNNVINEFLKNGFHLKKWVDKNNPPDCQSNFIDLNKECNNALKKIYSDNLGIFEKMENLFDIFKNELENGYNIYDNWNCSFINNNLNLMYRAMWDFAWETRILCALSCCIGFFGAIGVYSFLWVMHLWKREDNSYNEYNSYKKNKKGNNDKPSNNRQNKKYKKISPPRDIEDENQSELVNTLRFNENKNNNDDYE